MTIPSRKKTLRLVGIFLLFVFFFPILKTSATEIVATGDVSITAKVGPDEEETGFSTNSSGSTGLFNIPASVKFSGIAYPNSPVFILKNGQDFMETTAKGDATFSINISNLPSGSYTFSVVTEDTIGRRSTLYTFPLAISSNLSTNISGIFLSPTISVSGQTIKKGDSLTISGQGAPNATIKISLKSSLQNFFEVATTNSGLYSYLLDTNLFSKGPYQAKSKSVYTEGENESPYSSLLYFNIGDASLDSECGSVRADLNCDFKVNLIDFSILAFWYRKDNPPEKVDLIIDGRVDIRDFSILAYAWTG